MDGRVVNASRWSLSGPECDLSLSFTWMAGWNRERRRPLWLARLRAQKYNLSASQTVVVFERPSRNKKIADLLLEEV